MGIDDMIDDFSRVQALKKQQGREEEVSTLLVIKFLDYDSSNIQNRK